MFLVELFLFSFLVFLVSEKCQKSTIPREKMTHLNARRDVFFFPDIPMPIFVFVGNLTALRANAVAFYIMTKSPNSGHKKGDSFYVSP